MSCSRFTRSGPWRLQLGKWGRLESMGDTDGNWPGTKVTAPREEEGEDPERPFPLLVSPWETPGTTWPDVTLQDPTLWRRRGR